MCSFILFCLHIRNNHMELAIYYLIIMSDARNTSVRNYKQMPFVIRIFCNIPLKIKLNQHYK